MKKFELQDAVKKAADEEREKERKRKLEQERAENMSNEELVIQRMGVLKYYLLHCLREGEREKIKVIQALSAQLDAKVGA